MLTPLILCTGLLANPTTAPTPTPSAVLVLNDEQEYRTYARMSREERTAYRATLPNKKARNAFKRGFGRWLKAIDNYDRLCNVMGLPDELSDEFFVALDGAPLRVQNDFRDSLKRLPERAAFQAAEQEWRNRKTQRSSFEADLVTILAKFESATNWIAAVRTPEGREAFRYQRTYGAQILREAIRGLLVAPDLWRAHAAEHVDCPAAPFRAMVDACLDATPPADPMEPRGLGLIWAAAEASGERELAYGLAQAAVLDREEFIHPSGQPSSLLVVLQALELGPYWYEAHLESNLDRFVERQGTKATALETIARLKLLATTGSHRNPSLSPSDLTPSQYASYMLEHERKLAADRAAGESALKRLIALGGDSPRALEVVGLYALCERRSGSAYEAFRDALAAAERDGVALKLAPYYLPIAHVLAKGPEGLAPLLERAATLDGGTDLVMNLANAWGCAPFFIDSMDSDEARTWQAALALRCLRVGQPAAAMEFFDFTSEQAGSAPELALTQAWTLLARGRDEDARAAARRALDGEGAREALVWRSARIIHQGGDRLNDLLPSSADRILGLVARWESDLGGPCVGSLSERALLLGAVGRTEEASVPLGQLVDLDASAADGVLHDLRELRSEAADALATSCGRSIGVDQRAELRSIAKLQGLDWRHTGQGLDDLRVLLESASRSLTASRKGLIESRGLIVPDEFEEGGDALGIIGGQTIRITSPAGETVSDLAFTHQNGEQGQLSRYAGRPCVIYAMAENGPSRVRLTDAVDALASIEDKDCEVLVLFLGAPDRFEAMTAKRPDRFGCPVVFATQTPRDWIGFLMTPQLLLMDRKGQLATHNHSQLKELPAIVEHLIED